MAATWWNRLGRLLARFGARRAAAAPEPAEPPTGAGAALPDLITALSRAGIEPDARELAEVLWLASHLDPPPSPRPRDFHREEPRPADAPDKTERPEPKRPAPASGRPPAVAEPVEAAPRLKVHPRAGGGGARGAAAWRAPGAPALPDALGLARSLRPLSRRVPSRTRRRLDEDATAEAIAGQRLSGHAFWEPVWVPAAERWFELALVIDRGATMAVWAPVLEEFRRLLDYSGAFQRVRIFTLATDGGEPCLRSGTDPRSGRAFRPEILAGASTRRLILIASDCVGPAWHAQTLNGWLRLWGKSASLALMQMLPRRLWDGTGLGRGDLTRLCARRAAPSAAGLERAEAGPWPAADAEPELRVPVLTLEAPALRGWGKLLAGRREAWCAGVCFGRDTLFANEAERRAVREPDSAELDLRLSGFLAAASPLARKLAGLLAAAPLTLPTMRLVQRAMLPGSGQIQLAEILLSGLLRRHPQLDAGGASPFYDFRGDTRRRLLDLIGERESREVLVRVSAFVAERSGQALDFAALIAAPDRLATTGIRLDDANTRHFAEIGAQVLGRLGGRYAELARELAEVAGGEWTGGGRESEPIPPAGPTPFNDPFKDGGAGPDMVWLPGGTFRMGSPEGIGRDEERPAHDVTLSHYAVGKYPVTVGEFRRFVKATGYRTEAEKGDGAYVRAEGTWEKRKDAHWNKPYFEQGDRNPVVCISWNDAKAYCQWLSEQTGQAYGLPTEAQWEHACRAGSGAAYGFGDDPRQLGNYAWYSENSDDRTHRVGEKSPNAWGLHDLHGNVWEWCEDWYGEDYYRQLAGARRQAASVGERTASSASENARATGTATSDGEAIAGNAVRHASENPGGPAKGSGRVIRGGSWLHDAGGCRSACRLRGGPSGRIDDLGFRLSRTGPLPSYPFTLGGAAAPATVAEDKQPLPPAGGGVGERGFTPYQVFHDRLDDFADAESPAMVYLPGGEFLMGDEKGGSDEKPVHRVRLDAYALGRTPVTVGEYLRFCQATNSHWPEWLEPGSEYHLAKGKNDYYRNRGLTLSEKGSGQGWEARWKAFLSRSGGTQSSAGPTQDLGLTPETLALPVMGVAWADAVAYCEWLGEQTGQVYELPTEAQWEYACRAGTTTRWCHGDDEERLEQYAWYAANAEGRLHPVAGKLANAWGLHDLHGNV